MHYCKPGPAGAERTERTVDPYMLWHLDGRVRLVGWCHLRQTRRRFLIERIESVEVLDESFEPDPTFDPREHVQHGFGGWDGPPERVVVDFTPAVAHLLSERRFHPHQRVEPLADGGGRLVMHVPGIPRLAAWVASFGGLVVAREPRRLVDAVRAMHAAGLQAHGAAASDTEGHDPV
jgi:predicted DNA-binding transcriptional regulator YafY